MKKKPKAKALGPLPEGKPKGKDPKKAAAGRKGARMKNSHNRKAIQANRQRQIMAMVLEGKTTAQIGKVIGLSQPQTWVLYDQALKLVVGERDQLAERERGFQLQITGRAVERYADLLFDPDVRIVGTDSEGNTFELPHFEMVNKIGGTLVKFLERRANLTGADMPTKVEGTVAGTGFNQDRLDEILNGKMEREA